MENIKPASAHPPMEASSNKPDGFWQVDAADRSSEGEEELILIVLS